ARECPPGIAPLWIHNKIDLVAAAPGRVERIDRVQINVSARTGAGLDDLRAELARRAGATEGGNGAFSARARHVEALERVAAHLETGAVRLRDERAGELLAEELRQAQAALGTITGTFTSDDLLGAIFSSFCIGK
ncbi:MAG TPA: tRNA uridine-5-carboxymethylaminomethyl(34) synthesis GTPase MnmE, partial [Xanthomonadales bacterium]|nr:tRNA uridine-5-carboxymethylaminomethyl(34) synthesis GTPase MnmE [Xanthomonadales bacterium]